MAKYKPRNRREKKLIDAEAKRIGPKLRAIEDRFFKQIFTAEPELYPRIYEIHLEIWNKTIQSMQGANRFVYTEPIKDYFTRYAGFKTLRREQQEEPDHTHNDSDSISQVFG